MRLDAQADDAPEKLEEALVRGSYRVMGILTRLGAEHDLSLSLLRVLGILRDRRLRVSDLADRLGLDKSTMSGLVDRAERRGLLARGKNPEDGRAVDVYATPAGRELAARLHTRFRRALKPSFDRFTPERRAELVRLLTVVLEEADKGVTRPGRDR
ncbi:MarR family transcriptional regulator [Thermopolyspora sp. NPDC052614]|uniref:MarR family winged helix-turn-helix transcriptional regulator n=1 Tax=Thermopolyspora sp. NPDC052614 TaxID=3155682 RepID=UPI0034438A55